MLERVSQPRSPRETAARLLGDLRQDLHYAARQLRRAPGFAALVIATLAIGIGANATMVGVIDRLLFRAPLHVQDPDRLSRLVFESTDATGKLRMVSNIAYPNYLQLQKEVSGFSALAGVKPATLLPLYSDNPGAEALVSMVTANYFETLRVSPTSGRFFGVNDGFPAIAQNGGPALAVISHGFWQREYGGRADIVGNSIHVGKLTYTIVGTAPPGFRGIETAMPDVWVPITVALEQDFPRSFLWAHEGSFIHTVARLADGVHPAQVNAQATTVMRAIDLIERDTASKTRLIAAPIVAARGPDAPQEVKITLWLGGVSALVLLIVCANVANLLLGRAFTRRREIAVRLALGAGRGRLARQLLTEALLLSGIGGVAGLCLAAIGGRLLQQRLVTDISTSPMLDVRLLSFTLLTTIVTGVVVSLVPMVQSTAPDLSNGLRTGSSNGVSHGFSVRSVLLTTQAAMCVVLLVGAGLFAQSLRRVEGLDVGVDLDHTLQVPLWGMDQLQIPTSEGLALANEMKIRLAALPGVARVALASSSLLGGGRAAGIFRMGTTFETAFPKGSWSEAPYEAAVDSGMFTTLRAQSLEGRDFNGNDRAGSRRVTILNAPLARRVFGDVNPIGKCVTLHSWGYSKAELAECVEVVGVMHGYYRRTLTARDGMVAFTPLAQRRSHDLYLALYVSTRGPGNESVDAVRSVVHSVRPDLRKLKIQSMRDFIEPEMRPWTLAATMFVSFGAVALTIAMIGLYAVVSFSVAQRTSEIAVRLALGARTQHITAAVSAGSLYAIAAGLGIGIVVSMLLSRSIGPLLFQTSPNDPFIIVGVASLLLLVAIVAMIVPLVRALRVNPSEVMRSV